MNKLWLIAQYEYGRRVSRRSFLLGTLGVPLAMGVATLASVLLHGVDGPTAAMSPGPFASFTRDPFT